MAQRTGLPNDGTAVAGVPRARSVHRGAIPVGARKADFVYDTIKRDLVSGVFSLGTELVANDLAAALGTSRQPVMDALKRLHLERLVDVIPQVGCRVSKPTPDEVDDFYLAFAMLEGLITELAARRRQPGDVDQIRQAAAAMTDIVGREGRLDNVAYSALNRAIHAAIHDAANATVIRQLAESCWDRSDFLIASMDPPLWRSEFELVDRDHHDLVDVIADGEFERARSIATEHIRRFGDAVVTHLRRNTQPNISSV